MLWRPFLVSNNLFLLECIKNRHLFYLKSLAMPFYAVARGKTAGIFMTWPDCEAQVKGFSGAKYKKFNTVNEAQDYINLHGSNVLSSSSFHPQKTTKKFLKKSSSTVDNVISNKWKNYSKTIPKTSGVASMDSEDDDWDIDEINKSIDANENKSSHTKINKISNTSNAAVKRRHYSTSTANSNRSDDLNDVLNKQMDDIEKRIKGVERNVNNIIKKSVGSNVKASQKYNSSGRKTILLESPPLNKKKKNEINFEIDNEGFVQVYTDGACSSNGTALAKAGLGVYWGEDHPLNISEPVSGRATNNCGEIQAATKAIKIALQHGVTQLTINTDSKFLINSVTKWIPGWKRKGWKLKSGEPVKNEIDFKDLDSVRDSLTIRWNYVEAHRGVLGNEMADRLAKDGAAAYGC